MKTYIGTKIVHAKPMNRLDYNIFRGWTLPEDENPDDEGYLVEYTDGGKPNTEDYEGYVSWSPKDIFERSYNEIYEREGMYFGAALLALKKGLKVARKGWNGKGMWIVLMPSLYLPPFSSQELGAKVNDRTAKHIGKDTPMDCQPYFVMWTANQQWQPGWLASQADMLAEDWEIIP